MQESLDAAGELLEHGHEEISVTRAYYAMFYITEALLLSKDLAFSKHGGVIAAFGQHFVKTGLFKKELHEMLIAAFEERNEGDYGISAEFSADDAGQALRRAQTYCETVTDFLRQNHFLP